MQTTRAVASLKTAMRQMLRIVGHWAGASFQSHDIGVWVAVWRSGNVVGRIVEVTLCRARLVLKWVTAFAAIPSQLCNQPPRPTQPPTIRGVSSGESAMTPYGWGVRAARYCSNGSFRCELNVAGNTV